MTPVGQVKDQQTGARVSGAYSRYTSVSSGRADLGGSQDPTEHHDGNGEGVHQVRHFFLHRHRAKRLVMG